MNAVREALSRAVEGAGLPGAVALAASREAVLCVEAVGARGVDDPRPMAADDIFWLASMTKAVTSVAALQLVEEGALDLDAPIGAVLPQLARPRVLTGFDQDGAPVTHPARRAITLRHLLTHTSGLGYDFVSADMLRARGPAGPPPATDPASIESPLLFEPGERWQYGVSTDWVGRAVEAVSGAGLDTWCADRIFAPLGMTDTFFRIPKDKAPRLVPMHARTPEGAVAAIPSPAPAMSGGPFVSGGGGLSGTGGDYLRFLRAILNGGELDGARILGPQTVAAMTANQVGDLRAGVLTTTMPHLCLPFDLYPGAPTGWGLGFLINHEAVAGGRGAGALAWAGLANTYYWIDPAADLCAVVLTQLLPFGDPGALSVARAFETAVYASRSKRLAEAGAVE